jgi:uncharacterized Zn finger protein
MNITDEQAIAIMKSDLLSANKKQEIEELKKTHSADIVALQKKHSVEIASLKEIQSKDVAVLQDELNEITSVKTNALLSAKNAEVEVKE